MNPRKQIALVSFCSAVEQAAESLREIAHGLRPARRHAFGVAFGRGSERSALIGTLQQLNDIARQATVVEKRSGRLLDELCKTHLDPQGWQAWLLQGIEAGDPLRQLQDATAREELRVWRGPEAAMPPYSEREVAHYLDARRKELDIELDPNCDDEDWTRNICTAERVVVWVAFLSRCRANPAVAEALENVWHVEGDIDEIEIDAADEADDEAIRRVLATFDAGWCPSIFDLCKWSKLVGAREILTEMDEQRQELQPAA